MSNVVKFPFAVSRRAHARKPRASKNGTPEERAAKNPTEPEPAIDRRKLRGNPLRAELGPISFGVTVAGFVHTADLRGEPLSDLHPSVRQAWLESLNEASVAAVRVAMALDKLAERIERIRSDETSPDARLKALYQRTSPTKTSLCNWSTRC